MEGIFFTWMQDQNARKAAFVGPPGTRTTNLAKRIARRGLPRSLFGLGGTQSSISSMVGSGIGARSALTLPALMMGGLVSSKNHSCVLEFRRPVQYPLC